METINALSGASARETTGLQLVKHTEATGGVILGGGQHMRVTPIQLELLEILQAQLVADAGRPQSVRGFVSSCELLARLSWGTCHPWKII